MPTVLDECRRGRYKVHLLREVIGNRAVVRATGRLANDCNLVGYLVTMMDV
jgi:hypothetical protein